MNADHAALTGARVMRLCPPLLLADFLCEYAGFSA